MKISSKSHKLSQPRLTIAATELCKKTAAAKSHQY